MIDKITDLRERGNEQLSNLNDRERVVKMVLYARESALLEALEFVCRKLENLTKAKWRTPRDLAPENRRENIDDSSA